MFHTEIFPQHTTLNHFTHSFSSSSLSYSFLFQLNIVTFPLKLFSPSRSCSSTEYYHLVLTPLFIPLDLNWYYGLVVLFSIACLKQVIFIFILNPFHRLHQLHHCSPLKAVLTPRIKHWAYCTLRFFTRHQSCHYIHYCYDLTLALYVLSRNACCQDDTVKL